MVFKARELGIEVRLARMEDPLPDGPWDLVIVGALGPPPRRRRQARPVPPRARAVAGAGDRRRGRSADPQVTPLEEGVDFPSRAEDMAEWCGGEVVWEADDLAVIRAVYLS